jgi:hypothetical protein
VTLKTSRFLVANSRSAVVYFSCEGGGVTYRLADGSVWTLSKREAREIGAPRWAHLEQNS